MELLHRLKHANAQSTRNELYGCCVFEEAPSSECGFKLRREQNAESDYYCNSVCLKNLPWKTYFLLLLLSKNLLTELLMRLLPVFLVEVFSHILVIMQFRCEGSYSQNVLAYFSPSVLFFLFSLQNTFFKYTINIFLLDSNLSSLPFVVLFPPYFPVISSLN